MIERFNLVGGTGNKDTVDLFLNPTSSDLSTLTPYATATYTTATNPVQFGLVDISQFGSAGTGGQTGVNIQSLRVGLSSADVFNPSVTAAPEASSMLLMGSGIAVLGGFLLRRRIR